MSLQPQRTDLAWTRSSLSAMVLVLIGIRLVEDHPAVAVLPVALAFAGAVAFVGIGRWRSQQLRREAVPRPLRPVLLGVVVAAVVVADVAGAYFILS